MKTNYLFLAEGYEIAEAMCPVDMMTRGGLQVKTVSITINLSEKKELIEIARKHFDKGGITAAICAAPSVVLGKMGGLKGRRMCCYAGFESALEDAGATVDTNDGVVVDRNLITSRGAGHAIAFGLAIVAAAAGREKADRVAKTIML